MSSLMVILYDELSAWLAKGEVVEGYLNPGDMFDRVDVVLTNRDRPDVARAQPLVGSADLAFHNFPAGRRLFARTLGWRLPLLKLWARPIVALARELRPVLVRCHGAQLNAFAASEIRRRVGVPYVVSLHGNLDVDYLRGRRATSLKQRLLGKALDHVEVAGLRDADRILAVYEPIIPYLESRGLHHYEIVYNSVSKSIVPKQDYRVDADHVRLVCVGRQDPLEKNPAPIIDAVAMLPNVELTLVGTGGLHRSLRERAAASSACERVRFVEAMANSEVVSLLADSDIFVYCSDNYELSKGCMEAALSGLPIVVNDRGGEPAPELLGGHMRLVDGSPESYRLALSQLAADYGARQELGTAAAAKARADWSPEAMEARVVAIYRSLIAESSGRIASDNRKGA